MQKCKHCVHSNKGMCSFPPRKKPCTEVRGYQSTCKGFVRKRMDGVFEYPKD